MSFMELLRRSNKQKQKEKSAYAKAYDEEKRKLKEKRKRAKEERNKARLKRAEAKAKRDARNPLYKRLAKKAGAVTKEAVEQVAADIGKQAARAKEDKIAIQKVRRKTRMKELTRLAAKQEVEKVRSQFPRRSRPKVEMGNYFGNPSKVNLLDNTGDLLGLKKSKKKKSGFLL